MGYVDLQTILNPSAGVVATSTWGDQLRDNDKYLYERGPYICTSGTRPGSPFNGQQIFETDTYETLIYYSGPGAWRRPWEMPWGRIGHALVTSGQGSITTVQDLTSATVTFTAVANRYYKITAHGLISSTVTGDEGRVIVDRSGTTIQISQLVLTASKFDGFDISIIDSPAVGSKTYKLQLVRQSGTGILSTTAAATFPLMILVEDIGPSGSPT